MPTTKTLLSILIISLSSLYIFAQSKQSQLIEECGKFEKWRVLEIKESGIIGGNVKHIYKFNTGDTLVSNEPYQPHPEELFAPSNIMANIIGIIKTSNSVFPDKHGDGLCAKMEVVVEKVKVIGMINIDVVAQGTILIGAFREPITDTKSPYRKLDSGIPFYDRPSGLQYDYKALVGNPITRATGLSPRKFIGGPDYPTIAVFLQQRWEDEKGNIYASRVGTAYKMVTADVDDWIEGEVLPIRYGDISKQPGFQKGMALRNGEIINYTTNSRGDIVPIYENEWADANASPTHIIIWISSSMGVAFWGGIGNILWIDNVKLTY